MEVGKNGHSVVQLVGIGVGRIIDKQHILHISAQNSEILDEVALVREMAMLPIETVMDEIPLGVEIVQYLVGIAGLAGGEDDDLILPFQKLQQLYGPWPDVDPCLCSLSVGKLDGYLDIMGQGCALVAVDQGLV